MWPQLLRVAPKPLPALLYCAAVALLLQNIILVRENRELRSRPSLPPVAAGRRVRELAGVTLDGQPTRVDLPRHGSRLLVIAFSPNCPFCRANQSGWAALARTLNRSQWRVAWLSRDAVDITRPYCIRQGIPESDAIAEPNVRTYLQLGLVSVPTTIVIGPDGVVDKVWSGELNADSWHQLFAYFGLGDLKTQSRGPVHGADVSALNVLGLSPWTIAQ